MYPLIPLWDLLSSRVIHRFGYFAPSFLLLFLSSPSVAALGCALAVSRKVLGSTIYHYIPSGSLTVAF